VRGSQLTFPSKYQVTSVCLDSKGQQVDSLQGSIPFQETSSIGLIPQVFCGSLDNEIKVWDVRKDNEMLYSLQGHTDTITGMSLSPDGAII